MVCDVVAGLQKLLIKDQYPIKSSVTIHEPHEHVENYVQSTPYQLADQLHQMQTIMQAV